MTMPAAHIDPLIPSEVEGRGRNERASLDFARDERVGLLQPLNQRLLDLGDIIPP